MQPYEWLLTNYFQKEIVGEKHNPWIVALSTAIGNTWIRDDETAWCSEAVNAALLHTGYSITGSAVARSFLKWGEETNTPVMGDIVVFWRNPKGSNNGHVGFYINETPTHIRVLGGNQNNEVNISEYSKEQLLSYRKVPKKALVGPNLDQPFILSELNKIVVSASAIVKKLK